MKLDQADVRRSVRNVRYWRHRISLPFGVVTPGRIGNELIQLVDLPKMLSNRTVLDIGTFDGLLAFEAERRGAKDVLAIDTWDGAGTDDPKWWAYMHSRPRGFRVAHALLNSKVRWKRLSVYSLCAKRVGVFDYVLMCGLLYHLSNPFLAIKNALSVTKRRLIIESAFIAASNEGQPLALFVKHSNRHLRPSVWWEFSAECLQEFCKAAGAKRVIITRKVLFPIGYSYTRIPKDSPLYDRPSCKATMLSRITCSGAVRIASWRATNRDGFAWLRTLVQKSDGATTAGWLRFNSAAHIPPIERRMTKPIKREGRIVIEVQP